jgi:3-methyladenine DNA glycosylase AlkD
MLTELRKDVKAAADPERAELLQRYFKTGPGEYGEGDMFLGLTVPISRSIARKYKDLPFRDIKSLLQSKYHEERLIALLILVHNFEGGYEDAKEKIYDFYLENADYINNWDLVDLSAHKIVGGYLATKKDRSILEKLAKSKNVWERRIAAISTFNFIRDDDFEYSLKIAHILLGDSSDLIHKAVGWMLREIGKRSPETEERFLKKHYKEMPRTMLRYAIEKFPEEKRKTYLKGLV